MKKLVVLLGCCFLCFGCSSSSDDGLISYMEAKEKIINDNAILVDVRTQQEYDEDHIAGAILFTLDTIDEQSASSVIGDKDTEIIVYCESGTRSSEAIEILESLGYVHVYNLGAMSNWKE